MEEFSKNQELLNQSELHKLRSLITKWSKSFSREDTWIQSNHGVPSLMVSLDCVINRGNILILEIDEAPKNLDLLEYNQEFINVWNRCYEYWPKFKLAADYKEYRLINTISVEDARRTKELIFLESTKDVPSLKDFQNRSVSTCLNRGDRSYGLSLNLWKNLDCSVLEKGSDLDFENSFCLKSYKKDTSTELSPTGTAVYMPRRLRQGKRNGITTKSKVLRIIEREKNLYLQDCIPPMKFCSPISKKSLDMLYRFFFLYNFRTRRYEYAGGLWLADGKLNGTAESLFGCILYEPVRELAGFMD